MKNPRRVALLVELPAGLENAQMAALRRFLKVLVRTYGIRCLSVLPPKETRTFGSHAANNASIADDTTPNVRTTERMLEVLTLLVDCHSEMQAKIRRAYKKNEGKLGTP